MPEERSLIASFTESGVPGPAGLFRVRPVVLDTTFLLQDVRRAALARRDTALLDGLRFGTLRGFAGYHAWAEVPRRLPDISATSRLDPELLEAIWWDHYVPKIFFVDTEGLPLPRREEIERRDLSDAPTFALASLLAPVVVLAADHDIRDAGLVHENWWAMPEHAGVLVSVAKAGWAGVVSFWVGGHLIAGLVRAPCAWSANRRSSCSPPSRRWLLSRCTGSGSLASVIEG